MSPRLLFRTFAFAEVVTWAGLIAGLILRATGVADIVSIVGGIHGFVFLCYGASTIFVWINQKWSLGLGIVGLITTVIPFATVPFEIYVDKRGKLQGPWRLAPGGEKPKGFFEHVQAWVLAHLLLAVVLVIALVVIIYVVLLQLGPPVQLS